MSDPIPLDMPKPIGKARKVLLRRLIDYVALPSSRLAPQDRSMAGDILLDMLFHASEDERKLCARRLATMPEAPRRVLRYLAQCAFPIAQPLLESSEAFNSSDLFQMIDQTTPEHRLAIAGRKRVQPIVCDKLSDIGEGYVIRRLISNPGAEFSEHAMDVLVARSRKDEQLTSLLIKRPELRPAQAMAMFWWADGPTRSTILQRYAADRLEMINMCSDVFALAADEGWQDPVARKTLQLIERRQRNRAALERSDFESLEAAVEHAAQRGMGPEVAQEIGYLSGVKPVTVAKLLSDVGGEGIAVLCKSTGLDRKHLALLWVSLGRELKAENDEISPRFAHVAQIYDMLSVARAQTTLRYWNWSLSSTYSPARVAVSGVDEQEANDESAYSTSVRTARLVFGK